MQDRQNTHKSTIEARSFNHCCSSKAIIIKYYEPVSVLLPWSSSSFFFFYSLVVFSSVGLHQPDPERLPVLSQPSRPCNVFPFFLISFHICSFHPILRLLLTPVPLILVSHSNLACLSYPACKSHSSASYYSVICGLSLPQFLSTLPHQRHDFRGDEGD